MQTSRSPAFLLIVLVEVPPHCPLFNHGIVWRRKQGRTKAARVAHMFSGTVPTASGGLNALLANCATPMRLPDGSDLIMAAVDTANFNTELKLSLLLPFPVSQ